MGWVGVVRWQHWCGVWELAVLGVGSVFDVNWDSVGCRMGR